MNFYKKIIVIVGVMSVFSCAHSDIGIERLIGYGSIIGAYPTYCLARSLDRYYRWANDLEAFPDVPKESFEYQTVARLVPNMQIHGKQIKIKDCSSILVGTMLVNSKKNFYLFINQSVLQHLQSSVNIMYPNSNQGSIIAVLRFQKACMENNHGDPRLVGAVALGAMLVGGGAQCFFEYGLQNKGPLALPISAGLTWLSIEAHKHWEVYRADKRAYQESEYNEIVSKIVDNVGYQYRCDVHHGTSIIDRIKLYMRQPKPFPVVRAHAGNAVVQQRFGESKMVDIGGFYSHLKEHWKDDAPLKAGALVIVNKGGQPINQSFDVSKNIK